MIGFLTVFQIVVVATRRSHAWVMSPHVTTTGASPLLSHDSYCHGRRRDLMQRHVLTPPAPISTTTTSPTTVVDDYHDDDDEDEDDSMAQSAFGTKSYWDDVYQGMGDFPADLYSWYGTWDDLVGPHFLQHCPPPPKQQRPGATSTTHEPSFHILVPGIGNDSTILDLQKAGYNTQGGAATTKITAFDYSAAAMERQEDLLWGLDDTTSNILLQTHNCRNLPDDWTNQFDAICEKGLLDAVYLSSSDDDKDYTNPQTNRPVREAVRELHRVLQPGAVCVSVSGVVPAALRRDMFGDETCWRWLRDGSDELHAGVFVFQKV